MTMTHSEKSNNCQMKAWPYRPECRGHDPHEKESVVLLKLALWQGVHLHTVKDSVQCIRDSVVESVISLILESCNHANHATQVQHDVVLALFNGRHHCVRQVPLTRAARDRPHLEDASITQLFKSTVRSGSLLGNKRYLPDQTLQMSVQGTNLKLYNFTQSFATVSTPSPKTIT